jgi:hypothetical protein
MRRLSAFQRIASVLLGCWLALFAAELPAVHTCAVHDVHAQMHHSSHHPGHTQHASCTCPGACCPGVGARLETPPELVPARIVGVVELRPAAPAIVRRAAARVVLPPAIGPPAISG